MAHMRLKSYTHYNNNYTRYTKGIPYDFIGH